MPFYDYSCIECDHKELDVIRPIIEDVSVLECTICGSNMKQFYSSFGFNLKGDGWAKDGYGNKAPKVKETKKDTKKKDDKKKESKTIN